MKVSVVCATFNRGPLLERALYTYALQTMRSDDWEYLLVDDGSTDNTREMCYQFTRANPWLPLRVLDAAADLDLPKQLGQWRDGCKLRNAASRLARGEVIISTHPEIMIPPQALAQAYAAVRSAPHGWHTAIPYWLPFSDIDSVDWQGSLHKLHQLPNFYDPSWPDPVSHPGGADFRNQHQERRTDWESEVWWAMTRVAWYAMGGFREFDQWGSVDMDFLTRRRALAIPTHIIQADSRPLMVYHQFHDSPRDVAQALAGVQGLSYSSPEEARQVGGLWEPAQ